MFTFEIHSDDLNLSKTIKLLGPGLLYAGAAVGVSHLVQSTRAGANFGYELIVVLILAHAIKYPFLEFGPRYAAATGKNLIDGYRQVGKWAVVVFAVLTVGTMFSVQAAVTLVTAGLAAHIFGINLSPVTISALILSTTTLVLLFGRYGILDKLIKYVIILLAVSTVVAVFAAAARGPAAVPELGGNFSWLRDADVFFLIAFIGWMPAPLDITVWQSLWINAKYKGLNIQPRLKDVLLDFRIGFLGTALLALCFLILGALVIYGTGRELSASGTVFAGQLIELYTSSIGTWSYAFIAAAALTTMFSTTMTCLDAYPRVMVPVTRILFPKINPGRMRHSERLGWTLVLVAGALILMSVLSSTMRTMVDIATTLSFLAAPFLAILNYRVVTDSHVPKIFRPNKGMKTYAWIGIVLLTGFTLFYIGWNFLK